MARTNRLIKKRDERLGINQAAPPVETKKELDTSQLPASAQERLKADPNARFGARGSSTEGVFRNETGRLSGISTGGKDFLGLSPEDVGDISRKQLSTRELPEDVLQMNALLRQEEQAKILEAQRITGQELSANLDGAPQELTGEQAPIDWGQAIGAGVLGNLPSILTSTAAGFGGGALAGGGIGSIPLSTIGAALGLAGGIVRGVQTNIKNQQSGEVGSTKDYLSSSRTGLSRLVKAAAADPANALFYDTQFQAQLRSIDEQRAKLKAETSGFWNKITNDGTDDISDFDAFNLFERPVLVKKMQFALENPSTTQFSVDDFIGEAGE